MGSLCWRYVDNSNGAQRVHHFHVVLRRQHRASEHALKFPGCSRIFRIGGVLLVFRLGQENVPAAQDIQLILPDSGTGRAAKREFEF